MMLDRVRGYFGFKQAGTTFGREIVAGITTFVTMSYNTV
jgi:xanthine/uracil/vitamin C permease (AzgA family)